jgi:hypothetical protein
MSPVSKMKFVLQSIHEGNNYSWNDVGGGIFYSMKELNKWINNEKKQEDSFFMLTDYHYRVIKRY